MVACDGPLSLMLSSVCISQALLTWCVRQCFFCYPAIWLFSEGFASFSVSFEVRV